MIEQTKQIQRSLNKISLGNFESIANELIGILEGHGKDAYESLIDATLDRIMDASPPSDTLLVAFSAIVACIYISGLRQSWLRLFYSRAIQRLSDVQNLPTSTLSLVSLLSHLFCFEVIEPNTLFEILRGEKLHFSEELQVDFAGPHLRQTSPSELKEFILGSRKKFAALIDKSFRFRFMLEQLDDLKNNRVKRFQACISDQANLSSRIKAWSPSPWERCTLETSQVKEADFEKNMTKTLSKEKGIAVPDSVSRAMNTEIRRAIFSIFASGMDQEDTALALLRLNLSAKSELEVPIVALFCCKKEKVFNPFYPQVLSFMFREKRRVHEAVYRCFGLTVKGISVDSLRSIVNASEFFSSLFCSGVLNSRAFKMMDLHCADDKFVLFARLLLAQVLSSSSLDSETLEALRLIFPNDAISWFAKRHLSKAKLAELPISIDEESLSKRIKILTKIDK